MADEPPELLVADMAELRRWLTEHHDDPAGVRLVLAKKGTVAPTTEARAPSGGRAEPGCAAA